MPNKKGQASWIYSIAKPLLERTPSLYPVEEWDSNLDIRIEALELDELTYGDREYWLTTKAGLHLLNESLDKSHAISQEIANATGSYWHALMHRMEGDYNNAKYWFSDVGHHPIHAQLVNEVRAYLAAKNLSDLDHEALRAKLEVAQNSPVWNASVFADAIEIQVTLVQDSIVEEWLSGIQGLEMKLLLQYSYEKSCGGNLLDAIGQQ